MESFKLEKKEDRIKRQKTSAWSWKINPDDLKNQVDNYYKLKITESYRGISVLLIVFSIILTLILIWVGSVGSVAILDLIILAIIAFFVYRGHRWAIIALMFMWTIEKGYQVYTISQSGISPAVAIVWWFIFMPYFWKALKVENEKRKLNLIKTNNNVMFCKKCGGRIEGGAEFCGKCGNKIT